jgi:hypothetical protein
MNYREDCLSEAEECDRLAGLASTLAVRNLIAVCIPVAQARGKGNGTAKRSWPLLPDEVRN